MFKFSFRFILYVPRHAREMFGLPSRYRERNGGYQIENGELILSWKGRI